MTNSRVSRTIVQDTLSNLITILDKSESIDWRVELIQDPRYLILQSVINPTQHDRRVELQLWIQRDPFQITAVRVLESLPPAIGLPQTQSLDIDVLEKLRLATSAGAQGAVVWRTKPRGLRYQERSVILAVEKSVTADFMGFGEQGGKGLFKRRTYMNYFSE